MILHVQEQGAELRLSGETISIWAAGMRIGVAQLPLVEQIILHGGVHLTTPLLSRLLAEGIDCAFLTLDGRFKGRLEALGSRAARLRVLQALAVSRPELRLNLARRIVRNKINAQARCCRVLAGRDHRALGHLQSLRRQALTAGLMSELHGIEGYASRVYFAALKEALPSGWGNWRRGQRGARDGLNALLNYGYALLQTRVHAAVAIVGLDPYLGFLHQLGRPRPAFVLDMMEEFRPLIVETTVWWLLPRLGEREWWTAGESGVLLKAEARTILLERLERRFAALTLHQPSKTRTTLSQCMQLQVRSFASLLQGGRRAYAPVRL